MVMCHVVMVNFKTVLWLLDFTMFAGEETSVLTLWCHIYILTTELINSIII